MQQQIDDILESEETELEYQEYNFEANGENTITKVTKDEESEQEEKVEEESL